MKMPTRLLVAGIAAAVLPLMVPGFAWLIHGWFGRVVFTFALVFLWCTLLQARPGSQHLRERTAMNGAVWSIVGGLLFAFLGTLIFPIAHVVRVDTHDLIAQHRAWNANRARGGVRHFG